jgi:hypothetical protein
MSVSADKAFSSQVSSWHVACSMAICFSRCALRHQQAAVVALKCRFQDYFLQTLSTNMKQKSAIARCALLLQPRDQQTMHWAAEMAVRLLQERHATQNHSSSSSSSSCWEPWIASLPQHVATPAEFTADEVQQLVLPSTVQVRCLICHTS